MIVILLIALVKYLLIQNKTNKFTKKYIEISKKLCYIIDTEARVVSQTGENNQKYCESGITIYIFTRQNFSNIYQ